MKNKKPILSVEIGIKLREILREICKNEQIAIIKGYIAKDYMYLIISVMTQTIISNLVQKLKNSTYKLLTEFPELRKQFDGDYIWARGYFCCTGNVTDETIKHYVSSYNDYSGEKFLIESEIILLREVTLA